MSNTDILTEEQVAKVAETVEANYPLRLYLSRFGIDVSALCRTLRAAWTENEQLQAQIEKLVDECGNWRARAEDLAGHALEDDE